MKNAVFWDVTPCGSFKNQRTSETSLLKRATWRNIPEDIILQSHRRENLKSYIINNNNIIIIMALRLRFWP
jgi:hypothetical protein